MKINKKLLQKRLSYLEGGLDALSEDIRDISANFKKQLSNRFYAINGNEIDFRIKGSQFHVSHKLDGHMQVVFFDGSETFMCGRNGSVRTGLDCLNAVGELLKKKKVKSFVAAAELYVKSDKRSRVYDVTSALADKKQLSTLDVAFFELIEVNGENLLIKTYAENFQTLHELIPENIVLTKVVSSIAQVKELYEEWVIEGKQEGLVVRTDTGFSIKVKPVISFDVVIVGYAQGVNEKKGRVKSFLFAFKKGDQYQVVGKVGNIPESERVGWFERLQDYHTSSNYIETDNEGLAFHFVRPEIVIEVLCNDIMTETSRGVPLMNPLLAFDGDKWEIKHSMPGVKFINLVFERERTDKTCTDEDIGTQQFEKITEVSFLYKPVDEFPASTVLFREVYKKTAKDKIMVQKFMVLQTNKDKLDNRFPAYVYHYTDFSSGRAEPLKKEVKISSSEAQVMAMAQEHVQEKVKKGWAKVE